MYYGCDFYVRMSQWIRTGINDYAASAVAYTHLSPLLESQAWLPGLPRLIVPGIYGTGSALNGHKPMILWGGPLDLEITTSEYADESRPGWAMYSGWEVAEWTVTVDDEGAFPANNPLTFFSLESYTNEVRANADIYSMSDYGAALAMASSDIVIMAEGYAEFYSN